MQKSSQARLTKFLFYLSLGLIIYMPLHVLIVQSASLLTGGIDLWKAGKDVVVFLLVPFLLFLSYKRGFFKDKTFRLIMLLGLSYGLLHGLFLLFDSNDDTYSTIVASVFNTRLLVFLLIGYLLGSSSNSKKYVRLLLIASVVIALLVSIFGILQYFLPSDLLTHVGYSLERGVKPLFFIDDKPDLPRIMSTLKDPNSLGAFLIMPLLICLMPILKKGSDKEILCLQLRRGMYILWASIIGVAIFLTFSRGALLALIISIATLLSIVKGQLFLSYLKKYWPWIAGVLVLSVILFFSLKDTYFVQNVIFHADEATVLEDPNELRVSLFSTAIDRVLSRPLGYGPGTAGLVSISNPNGGILTENYYLQIAHEVGWLGLALFISIIFVITYKLLFLAKNAKKDSLEQYLSVILLSALAGYLFYSLLIHLWSNEAIALQWWLLVGISLGLINRAKK